MEENFLRVSTCLVQPPNDVMILFYLKFLAELTYCLYIGVIDDVTKQIFLLVTY